MERWKTNLSGKPLVSLLIPAYQAARFLRPTLASVLAQTYPSLEIVVLNNNSSDGTAQILAEIDDPRVRIEQNDTTLNLPANWNRLVGLARGELIKVVCADDVIHPDCVAAQAAVLCEHPEVAVVACRLDFIDDEGVPLRRDRSLRGLIGPHSRRAVVKRVVRSGGNPIGPAAAVMFRREDFEAVGKFDETTFYAMDLDCWIRLLQRGSFIGSERSLVAFRIDGISLSANTPARVKIAEQMELCQRCSHDPALSITSFDRMVGAANTLTMELKRNTLFRTSAMRSKRRAKLRHTINA